MPTTFPHFVLSNEMRRKTGKIWAVFNIISAINVEVHCGDAKETARVGISSKNRLMEELSWSGGIYGGKWTGNILGGELSEGFSLKLKHRNRPFSPMILC